MGLLTLCLLNQWQRKVSKLTRKDLFIFFSSSDVILAQFLRVESLSNGWLSVRATKSVFLLHLSTTKCQNNQHGD